MKFPILLILSFCNFTLYYLEEFSRPVYSQSIQLDKTTSTILSPSMVGNCRNTCTILEGDRQENNLFHSFKEFNVDSGETVLFDDPGVQNILSRVTGINQSKILGTLGVSGGDANLFILNPNGILFGPDASLSLNGSFIATTANAIQFGDQGLFSASAIEIPDLTVNPSALLFQSASGAIENNSFNGLSVPPRQSLHLVGGDVIINNGAINAFGGRIELGGLAEPGVVNVFKDTNGFSLEFIDDYLKANVIFSNALIDVIGEGGGDIIVHANIIESVGSIFFAGINSGSGSRFTQSGNIEFNALESVVISEESFVDNSLLSNAMGKGGDIIINSKKLYVDRGSFLSTTTMGKGDAGDVVIRSSEKVFLDSGFVLSNVQNSDNSRGMGNSGQILVTTGELKLDNGSVLGSGTFGTGNAGNLFIDAKDISLKSSSAIASNVQEGGIGDGGEIRIHTNALTLTGGSQIASSVLNAENGIPGGNGQGGDIFVEASELVTLSGFSDISGRASGVFVVSESGSTGPAGKITINAGTFRITDGAIVSAETLNQSDGGEIIITSKNFEALNGGQIVSVTSDVGNAGDIKLNVTGNIILSGKDRNFDQRLNLLRDFLIKDGVEAADVEVEIQALIDVGPNSGLYASANPGASGKAGNISIDPRFVLIEDGARVSVDNQGTGPGGDIFLQSHNLTIDSGVVSATSVSNQGGNIDLAIDNLLLLKNNSVISSTAGNQNTGGNGGEVSINTGLLVAQQNSDITADAFIGDGGSIDINAFGVYLSLDSDITAKSVRGKDGEVVINNPEVDPSQSLTELPELVEPPQEIAQGCRPGQSLGGSTFTHVGRGGLPLSPHKTQTPTTVWQDLRSHNLQPTSISTTDLSPRSLIHTPPPSITEAQGWTKDTQGRIYLTANVPQPAQSPQPIATC